MPSDSKVNVLMVDDHPENLIALEAVLDGLGQNLVKASSGVEALRYLLHQDFAVILLDVQMPEMDGFETATLIRQRERSRHTPIIFLTAFSTNDAMVFKGYSLGAVDYLFKPIESAILTSKVSVFVDLYQKTEAVKQQAEQLEAMNAELRHSEERFRSLSASSPVGIFLLDTQGQCTYTNPRCQSICGFTFEKSLGEGWVNFLHPDDRDKAIADWKYYIQKQQESLHEYRFLLPDGKIHWTQVRTSLMRSDQGEVIGHVGTIEDITVAKHREAERKQAEEARTQVIREQAARQQAEAANRMKDEFLAVLSHELRTPLNSILGWAQMLRSRNLDSKTIARALETIERNARLQADLIEDILDVSRIIRGKLRIKLRQTVLPPLIDAALDSARPAAEAKEIKFEAFIEPTVPCVLADPDRLQQIVWNLLSNAIKFTPEAGTVTIKLSTIPCDPTETHWHTYDDRGEITSDRQQMTECYAQIEVIDTGVGISPEFLPHIFDRFRQEDSTTTRNHGGLGLGLAIVSHLVELHGGTITATSEGQGKGATFTVRLPILNQAQTLDPTETHSTLNDPRLHGNDRLAASPPLKSSKPLIDTRVLAVDDEPDVRTLMVTMLEEHGATVLAVDSVQAAIEVLSSFKPDIIISDIAMPQEDGYTLIHRLRNVNLQLDRHIPAIALTAHVRDEDTHQALTAGFAAHLSKPVERDELINTIAKFAPTHHHSAP